MIECMRHAAKVQQEESPMDKLTTELMECLCDKYCKHPCNKELDQEQLEDTCCECEAGQIVIHILNEYNRLNDFEKTQSFKMLQKISEKDAEINGLRKE